MGVWGPGPDTQRPSQLFDGGVHGVGYACLDGVDAVLIGAGTHATAEGLVADIALAGAGVLTAEGEDGGGALGAGEGALGVALSDGTENEVGDAVGHLVVGVDDGSGGEDVDDTAIGGDDIDGAPGAGIGRDEIVGVDNYQHPRRGLRARMVIE